MKVLILGANGFLGKECVKLLNKEGYDVLTCDRYGDVDYKGSLCDKYFVNSLPLTEAVINCAAVQYVTKSLPIFKLSLIHI